MEKKNKYAFIRVKMFLMPLQNGIYYPDTYQPITSHLHTSYLFLTRDFLFTYIQILLEKKVPIMETGL